ncbi:MAG TPA: class I lanthipeptide [Thermoanaerobaculia bacterium]|nr:class I lanthipeptide [Thermoanaerobaculia bacterium]
MKKKKKLTISKETVRSLEEKKLPEAAGADEPPVETERCALDVIK